MKHVAGEQEFSVVGCCGGGGGWGGGREGFRKQQKLFLIRICFYAISTPR